MKLGILGAGSIAGVMAKTVRLLNQNGHPEIELYAVAARQADRAEAFARANGVQRAYGGYEAMLADPAVDLVYIATPTPTITGRSGCVWPTASMFCARKPSPSTPARPKLPCGKPGTGACW